MGAWVHGQGLALLRLSGAEGRFLGPVAAPSPKSCFKAVEEALYRNIYGTAARRELAFLTARQVPPLSRGEHHELLEFVVPVVAARQVFNPLRFKKRTRYSYGPEERDAVHAQVITGSVGNDLE